MYSTTSGDFEDVRAKTTLCRNDIMILSMCLLIVRALRKRFRISRRSTFVIRVEISLSLSRHCVPLYASMNRVVCGVPWARITHLHCGFSGKKITSNIARYKYSIYHYIALANNEHSICVCLLETNAWLAPMRSEKRHALVQMVFRVCL